MVPSYFPPVVNQRTVLPAGHPSKVYTWTKKDVLLRGPVHGNRRSNKPSKTTEAKSKERFMRQLDVFMEKNGIKRHGDKSER